MRTPIRTRTDVTAALLMHRPMLSAVEAAVKSGAVDYTISRDENNVLGYITTAHGRMLTVSLLWSIWYSAPISWLAPWTVLMP